MNRLNQWREYLICIYKRYESIILFLYKIFIGILIFGFINSIGHARPEFNALANPAVSFFLIVLMGVFYAILPVNAVYAFIIVAVGIQFSAFLELSVFIVLFLLLILLFYARLAPKESLLIIGVLFAYYFKMPYIVPIYAGLYCGLTSIVPISIGVFMWHSLPVLNNLVLSVTSTELDFMEMPNTFSELFGSILNLIVKDISWISTSFVFAMVVIVVFTVVRLSLDYSKELAVGLGAVLNIIGFIFVAVIGKVNVDILGMFISTAFSWLFVAVFSYFDLALDYQRASNLRFEDDENYYYVKVIPKVIMSSSKRRHRHDISEKPEKKGRLNNLDGYDYEDYQPY